MKFTQKEKEIMFDSEFDVLFGIFEKELTEMNKMKSLILKWMKEEDKLCIISEIVFLGLIILEIFYNLH